MLKKNIKKIRIILILLVMVVGVYFIYKVTYTPIVQNVYTGFVASDNIYLSAAVSANLAQIFVKKGQEVQAGQLLFNLDLSSSRAEEKQIEAKIKEYAAQILMDEAILAKIISTKEASAIDLKRSTQDYERYAKIHRVNPGAVSTQDLDHALNEKHKNQQLDASMEREVAAQTAKVAMSEAIHENAQAQLSYILAEQNKLTVKAPKASYVEDVMYQEGEWVSANAVILSLVAQDNFKIRFFVPQNKISSLALGSQVQVMADGWSEPIMANINYISPRVEYTPPIIYSLENRAKLVFMLEALPAQIKNLKLGIPLTVKTAFKE